jgi:uncharacterized protein (TIGR02001 family)
MKLIRGGLATIGLLAVAGAAQAGVTSTWTATNDYDFRGITQTAGDPAIQASLDYAADAGWYVGAWASNIKFGVPDGGPLDNPHIETDFYGGYTKTLDSGLVYDVGAIYYAYLQETDFDYLEAYAGIGYVQKDGLSIKGKFFWSPDFGGKTTAGDTSAEYLSGDLSVPLPANFSFLAHVGYSFGDYWDMAKDQGFGQSYFDWNAGVGYTAGKFSLALKYIDGSDNKPADGTQFFSSESRVVFTIATTFPWGE